MKIIVGSNCERLNYITEFWPQKGPRVCKKFGNMIYVYIGMYMEKHLSPQVELGMKSGLVFFYCTFIIGIPAYM